LKDVFEFLHRGCGVRCSWQVPLRLNFLNAAL
jgi:hypothetical protein